jgi:hypothetical protein
MPSLDHGGLDLPGPVAAFIGAVNAGDLSAILATFTAGALVNDELQEHWGREAIAHWAARAVLAQRLSLAAARVVLNDNHAVVTAAASGTFDKRGLPDPLLLTFYFSIHDGKLDQLLILRNEPALTSAP